MEPLLSPENNRLTVLPIRYPKYWQFYKKMLALFWTADELDFSKDYHDFIKLDKNAQHFITMILSFFAASDTIVNMNLGERFIKEVQIREAIIAYDFQKMIENIHSEVYSLQIDNIIRNEDEKNKALDALQHYPSIKKKADWAFKWIESRESFSQRLIAFAIVEGVFFSGAFCAIFWLKKQNVMPGLCDSNEFIARDEGMHTAFACLLYNDMQEKLDQEIVHEMFTEAYHIEREFICDSLSCSLIGMNSELMAKYIKFVSDRLLIQLGYDKLWNETNPFDWMESISLENKGNFFETRVNDYQKSGVLDNTDKDKKYEVSEDF